MFKESLQFALQDIPKLFHDCTLESFKGKNKLKSIAQEFITDFSENPTHLFLTGPTGVGKTHLAIAVYQELHKLGLIQKEDFNFINITDFLFLIRATYQNKYDGRSEFEIVNDIQDSKLLILDDLGTEKSSDFAIQTLYMIINYRISNILPTIITTNLSLEEIEEKLNARIASRLCVMETVQVGGDDYRKKGK